jgi:hypothetical protein
MEYCAGQKRGETHGVVKRKASTRSSDSAPKRGREEAQERMIAALVRLERPLPPVTQFRSKSEGRQRFEAPPFQPPMFDSFRQTPEQWRKSADAAWKTYRSAQLIRMRYWADHGLDARGPMNLRGPGKTERNHRIEDRAEWAARRLSGDSWKEIAAVTGADVSTVMKAASEILRTAGWPTRPNRQVESRRDFRRHVAFAASPAVLTISYRYIWFAGQRCAT